MTPYEVLGLPPDADRAAAKAAYRKLAMQYHPDRNPGNADAAERMKDINDAHEAITKGRPWDGEYAFIIQIVVAIAGAGKTREYARRLAAQIQAHVIFAAPTIQLIREIEEWLSKFNASVPVATVHSGDGGRSVQDRIGKWFDQQMKNPDPRGGILVASHAAVLGMVPPLTASTFDLVIDEIPDVFSFRLKQIGFTHWWLTQYVSATAYRPGVLRLQPKDIAGPAYEKLRWIARNRPFDEGQAVYSELAAAVVNPHKLVLVLEAQWRDLVDPHSLRAFGGELDVLTILHPDRFRAWRSTTLMGARAHRTAR
jgi:hypothetical protein